MIRIALAIATAILPACFGSHASVQTPAGSVVTDSGYVQAPAGPLYYETRGTGPSVVLLHGGNLDRRLWDPQFELLSRQYRVVRYDVRPFGRSSQPSRPYSDVEDVEHLLDSLGIEKAAFAGLSLGGRIAVDFALTHPERVDRLVLVGAGLSGYRFSDEAARATRYRAAYDRGGIEEIVEEWLRDAYMRPAMENEKLAQTLRLIAHDNGSAWLRTSRPYAAAEIEPPAIARLQEIRAPTLIIIGERDVPDIHAIGRLLEQRIPDAKRVIIPNAGHIVNMEAPLQFYNVVLAFLRAGSEH